MQVSLSACLSPDTLTLTNIPRTQSEIYIVIVNADKLEQCYLEANSENRPDEDQSSILMPL